MRCASVTLGSGKFLSSASGTGPTFLARFTNRRFRSVGGGPSRTEPKSKLRDSHRPTVSHSHRSEDSAPPPRSFSQAARSSESRTKRISRERTSENPSAAPAVVRLDRGRVVAKWCSGGSSSPRRAAAARRACTVRHPAVDRPISRARSGLTNPNQIHPWLPETHPAVPAPRFRSPVHVRGARRVLRYPPDILDRRQVRREARPSSGAPPPPRTDLRLSLIHI